MLIPAFPDGARVGILAGLQSVNGPHIGATGTVVRSQEVWRGTLDYWVRTDDGEVLTYPRHLLTSV